MPMSSVLNGPLLLVSVVLRGVVAVGLGKRQPIGRVVRQANAVVVGLHALVALAVDARRIGAHAWQQAAGRIAGDHVRRNFGRELMRVGGGGLDAVQRLAVLGVGFTAHRVRDAGRRHQVALVRRIDEHAARVPGTAQGGDRRDAGAGFFDAAFAIEPLVTPNVERVALDQRLEDFFGDVRLEYPHAVGVLVVVAVRSFGLLDPACVVVVGLFDPRVEASAQAADHRVVAGVGPAQALSREPTQKRLGTHQDHALLHLLRLHRGDHAGRSAAVDHQIVCVGRDDVRVAAGAAISASTGATGLACAAGRAATSRTATRAGACAACACRAARVAAAVSRRVISTCGDAEQSCQRADDEPRV
jgi:hypothetical protein